MRVREGSGRKDKKTRQNAGTTLVELIVSMCLMSILMAAVVGILSPAAKLFVRMQRLQFAQVILDNVIQELRSMTQDAAGYVKVYDTCEPDTPMGDKTGEEEGLALEFLDTQGYVTLISTQGCPDTDIYLGTQKIDAIKAEDQKPGRLLIRYYAQGTGERYVYEDKNGQAVARALQKVFADGAYMGNYLEIIFSYPPGLAPGDQVEYLNAQVAIYRDEEKTKLWVRDQVILDLRYHAVKKTDPTAQKEW